MVGVGDFCKTENTTATGTTHGVNALHARGCLATTLVRPLARADVRRGGPSSGCGSDGRGRARVRAMRAPADGPYRACAVLVRSPPPHRYITISCESRKLHHPRPPSELCRGGENNII